MKPAAGGRFDTHAYLPPLDDDALLSLGCMEGFEPPVARARPAAAPARPSVWPGYLAAAAVAAAAYALHQAPLEPFRTLSPAILAILAGVAIHSLAPLPAVVLEGAKSLVRRLVPLVIVLIGAGLNLTSFASVGAATVGIVVACMALAMAAGFYCGRLFGLGAKTSLLIGAGTAICGNSAIIAVAPLIDADDRDILLAIGTVNLLGLTLMFLSPLAAGLFGVSHQAFGIWAGASIHAVPQAVAAGFAYSREAGTLATLVKLVRVAFLAPLVFALAAWRSRRQTRGPLTVRYARLVPMFVWGFLAVALLNTLGLIPELEFRGAGGARLSLAALLVGAGNVILTLAMAAVGLEVNVRFLVRVGARALLAGAAATALLGAASLALIRLIL